MFRRNAPLTGVIGVALSVAVLALCMVTHSLAGGPHGGRAVVSWDGSCGNSFWGSVCGSMTNWNNDQQTTLGDDVSIGPGDPVVSVVSTAQTNSLSCQSGLNISGSMLELAGSATIRNLTVNSNAVTALKINAGQVTLVDQCTWTFGRVGGAGVLRNEAQMNGGSLLLVDSATFVNANDVNLTGFNIGPNAGAINSASCAFGMVNGGSATGTGLFTNHGDFFVDPVTNSITTISCPYLQDTGSIYLNNGNVTNATVLFQNDATFSGGQFTIAGDARVRFQDPGGVGAVYTFDGLPAVTGTGNLYFEIPFFGLEVKVTSDLNVNLTGSDGLVINGRYTTVGAELRNQGKCRLLSGTIREGARSAGGGVPQLSNESGATMRLNGSGITVDTWLRNKAGGSIIHEFQGLQLGPNGTVTNHGTYEHHRGNVSRAATTGNFANYGTYVRPNVAGTQNETFQVPFVLNPGSIARFEKATTDFAFAIGSGTYFLGGTMDIWANSVVRIAGGSCEQADSVVGGKGQFHIGGYISGVFPFDVEAGRSFSCEVGPTESGDPADGGTYLRQGGRIGGQGTMINDGQFFIDNGGIGNNGAGTLVNGFGGVMTITSGQVNAGGTLINSGPPPFLTRGPDGGFVPVGEVKQRGGLTLSSGNATNYGVWTIETASTLVGNGTHEFLNAGSGLLGDGLFAHATPTGQSSTITARFNNQGLVRVDSGSLSFTNVVQVTGTTLTGGHWRVNDGATLDLPGSLTTIGPGAEVSLKDTANFMDMATIHTLDGGRLNLEGANWNRPSISVVGGGVLNLFNDISNPNTINNGTGVGNCILGYANTKVVPSLTGGESGALPYSLVCAAFNNAGTMRPGDVGFAGPFKLDGDYNQASNGTLQIELGGSIPVDEHDQLMVDGNVALDGYLAVRLLPGFTPSPGQQFTIITASNGTISGTFDQIVGYGQYTVAYAPNAVTLTVVTPPVPGDINGDGLVNVTDLLAIIMGWGVCPAQPAFCTADLNGDSLVNVTDLLDVIANWD